MERLHQAETGEAAKLLQDMLRTNVRRALYEIVEEEISGLCGAKHHPREASAYYRSGTSPSEVYLGKERTALKRPRVRRLQDGGSIEVHLKTWRTAQNPEAWEDAMMRAILCGVSTRNQQRLHKSELKGMSKSSVSRLWQRKAADLVARMIGRNLSSEPVLAVMLDGVHLADNLYALVCIGIFTDGRKEVLGFRIGTSENIEVVRDLVSDMVNRGMQTAKSHCLLAVLDGSEPLKRAVLEFFPDAIIQRCLVHKERNIRGYLSRRHWLRLSQLFADLRRAQGPETALEVMEALTDFLKDKNKAAGDSLEEAGEELLAFFRLNVPATLNKTFLSTNCIENAIKNLRRHIGRVCRWRHESDHPERWIASGLQLAQMGFRKIQGYRDLHVLQMALSKQQPEEFAA